MVELKKQVEELHEKKVPSTPSKVLEERSKASSEAVARIRKGEKLSTEAIEVVSMKWEALLEDKSREKVKENMCKLMRKSPWKRKR